MSLGLAIPLFDEAPLVEDVVHELQRVLESADIDYQLALVDNGSSDGTGPSIRRLAEHPRLTAVHLSPNAGYGGGILAGLEALGLNRDTGPAVLGWYWGDGQVAPRILPILYRHCRDGAALAKAERTQRYDGTTRRITGWGYAAWLRLLGVRTRDVNGCPKLLRKEILSQIAPRDTGWALDTEVGTGH